MDNFFQDKRAVQAGVAVLVAGALALFMQFANSLKEFRYIGRDVSIQSTIVVQGEGEVFVKPDVAEFTFSVVKEAKTVVGAREQADEVHNAIVAYLKESGVKEGDIKTVNYSLNPKYEWQAAGQVICRDGFCPPAGKQVVVGYEVHESISAKVRDIDGAGAILVGVTERGATNVNGPNLTVDNPDAAEREARAAAIKEAQAKAALLAKDLGVRLVRIVSFNESGATGPIFYGKEMAMGMGGDARAAPPSIEPGENRIVSNVSIVYEIR